MDELYVKAHEAVEAFAKSMMVKSLERPVPHVPDDTELYRQMDRANVIYQQYNDILNKLDQLHHETHDLRK